MSYEYEGDLLTKVTYPNDGTVSYEYDKEGNIHSVTDQLKRRYVTNEYDRKGRVVRQTLADGSEYIMFYNDRERKNTFTNVSTGEKTIYEYGRQKVVTKITYADGTTEHFDYDVILSMSGKTKSTKKTETETKPIAPTTSSETSQKKNSPPGS